MYTNILGIRPGDRVLDKRKMRKHCGGRRRIDASRGDETSVDQAEIARRTHRHEPAARRTRTKLKTEMADTRWYSFPAARRAPHCPYSIGLSTSFPTPTRTTQGTAAAPIRSATGYYADNQLN